MNEMTNKELKEKITRLEAELAEVKEMAEPSKELIDVIEDGNLKPISCPYCRQLVKEEYEDDV